MRKLLTKKEAFEEFIGPIATEDDGGWSADVWKAAWEAAFQAMDVYTADHDRQWREYALEIIDELK
jgi:hypothetical protein